MSCEKIFTDKLREQNCRLTPQREIVLSVLHKLEGLSTAETIWEEVHQRSSAVDISTVYRTLDLLQEFGLVASVDRGDGCRLYELLGIHGPHIHLICQNCGRVTGMPLDLVQPLNAELLASAGFQLDLDHVTLTGLCSQCARATEFATSVQVGTLQAVCDKVP